MERLDKIVKLLKVTRMHIVLGGILAFTLGALLGITAGGTFNPITLALCYLIVFFGDLSTHYSNDYFDADEDRLVVRRKVFSGRKILVDNPNLLPSARWISLGYLTTSISIATVAVVFRVAPVELLIITAGANFLGWFYSAPPLRLVSRGVGELAIALAAGFAIPAVGYISIVGHLDCVFAFFALPFLLYGFMLGLSLEAPDIELDRQGAKKNIGVRTQERVVFGLVLLASVAAFAVFGFLYWLVSTTVVNFWVVTVFAAIPLAAGIFGFICVLRKKKTDTFSAVNVASLFVFNLVMIVYLIFLIVYPDFL
jgi:1,4-dihydroxy-2-naphthoate octaprenyltransferase